MVSWLGFWAFSAVAQVQSLVGELRSQTSRGAAKEEETRKTFMTPRLIYSLPGSDITYEVTLLQEIYILNQTFRAQGRAPLLGS